MKKLLLLLFISLGLIACSNNKNVFESLGPWVHNERTLPFESFVTEWLSGDNFDAFYKYDVGEDFRESPGKYFGKEIPSLEGVVPSWNNNTIIYLSVPLDILDYDKKNQEGHQDNQRIWSGEYINFKNNGVYFKNTEPFFLETYYTVIGMIDENTCRKLAPNIKGECVDSRVVYFEDYGGGSLGIQFTFGMFGLFRLDNGKEYLVPLKYLTKKAALKYTSK